MALDAVALQQGSKPKALRNYGHAREPFALASGINRVPLDLAPGTKKPVSRDTHKPEAIPPSLTLLVFERFLPSLTLWLSPNCCLWVDDILVETDLDKIDGLEITATHDFRYDIDYFVELDEQVEDVVFIIERTG